MVVGDACNGIELVAAVRESAADVVVLDISMPRVDGLQAFAALRFAMPELGIVVRSGFDRGRIAATAFALGADKYLEKTSGMEEVRATVRAVATSRRTALSRPA